MPHHCKRLLSWWMSHQRKMTYHTQKKKVPLDKSVYIDPQKLFPEKLYDVVCDDYLLRWTDNGTWVSIVDEAVFEKEVMRRYPRFLQIPSFMNLRRLFREYNFEWRVNEETSQYEFYHSCFRKDKPELLADIKTRRKASTPYPGKKRRASVRDHISRKRGPLRLSQDRQTCDRGGWQNISPISSPGDSANNSTTPTQQTDADSTSNYNSQMDNRVYARGNFRRQPVRKDFSELKNTYWRNESENGMHQHSYYSGLPPEVWAHTSLPMCPTAVQVNGNSKDGDTRHSYQALAQTQMYASRPAMPHGDSEEKVHQSGKPQNDQSHNWGWGHMPYFYPPYYGEMYQESAAYSQVAQGQGAGDSDVKVPVENKVSPNCPQYPPYWGYPNYPYQMPWGCLPAYGDVSHSQSTETDNAVTAVKNDSLKCQELSQEVSAEN